MYTYIMKRTRTNIYLDAEQLKGLRAISAKSGAPISALIRMAIDAYLERSKKDRK